MDRIWIKKGEDGKEDTFVDITADQIKELKDEDKIAYFQAKQEAAIKALEDAQKEGDENTEELVKGLRDEIAKNSASTQKLLASMGAELVKMKKAGEETEVKALTFVGTMKKALKKAEISVEKLKSVAVIELDYKASQTAADIDAGTDFAQMLPGVGQIATRKTFMKSLFRNARTEKEFIKYNDQETIVRDAKNVAGCASSTHTSKITWKVRTLQMTKVRDFVDICIDMIDDYSFVSAEINQLVFTNVALKVDNGLLLGSGVNPELNSVDAVAANFAAGDYATSIKLAQLIDLIVVVAAQIEANGQENAFSANVVLMNIVDLTADIRLLKITDGAYLIPNYITSSGVSIAGLTVLTNPLIPQGQMYVMDSTKGTVWERKENNVSMSFENNANFESELVTVKAYERLNFLVRNVDVNAFVHVPDIDAAVTAITDP